ncbi:alanine racemase [Croceifilum oryzae]|uniref:Alanine racemase n=1 Tax=Croceifilum oryzae TaxID=1553429 RepID=A0AAJ1WSJ6_9BACL|nr:alanine racemase [Croceifilum oryzae]MDQ0417058.1 alanine racemase [Croceifilum oryzae]
MNTSMIHRDAWVEIYLDCIEENIRRIRGHLPRSTQFMAAVKANAYGHGDIQIAKIALKAGADLLAVALLSEAIVLRNQGIKAPILVLTPVLPSNVNLAIDYDLTLTVFQATWLKEMRQYKKSTSPLKIHLKMDTGLRRIGIREKREWLEILPLLRYQDVNLEGVYTHFATANSNDTSYYDKQYARFEEMMEWVKEAGISIPYYHCANSASSLRFPEKALDVVRIGVAMFGIYPSQQIKEEIPFSLQPALSLHSKIAHIKKLKAGDFVGYDNAYQAEDEEWVATIPIGYADGWFRCFQGMDVLIDGKKMPIISKICMDQIMVKLPCKYPLGTQVTLIGRQGKEEITLYDLAEHIGSVPQEIPSMITYRVPKIYYYHGEIVEIVSEGNGNTKQSYALQSL